MVPVARTARPIRSRLLPGLPGRRRGLVRLVTHDPRPASAAPQPSLPRHRNGATLLLLLLAADLILIGVHLMHELTPFLGDRLYSLETDRGYAETFQYLKTFWIVLLLGVLWWRTHERVLAAWALLFGYLLCDDALQWHEHAGYAVAKILGLSGAFGLRAQDLGELAISAAVGGTMLGAIAWLSRRASRDVRNASLDLGLLLAALLFFGVFMDMLHILAGDATALLALGTIEDGGEMLAMSAACAYALQLEQRNGSVPVSLLRALRAPWRHRMAEGVRARR